MQQIKQPAEEHSKKKLAFLLGITPNLAFAAGNVALSINKHMKSSDYDIVIYYTDLPDKDIQAFNKINHVVLKQFNLPEKFVQTMLQKMPTGSRFKSRNHLMCFAHFEVFPLLDIYENVAWIDVDTSIQRDLSNIVRYTPFGISPDTPWTVGNQFSRPIEEYDMDITGHCTAVMIVNDSLPYQKIHSWLYEQAEKYADALINPDQAIISIMLQAFNITPKLMPLDEWQCISWKEKAHIARIVHFGNARKVWKDTNMCNAFPEWYRTHLEWLNLGGSDFKKNQISPHNILGTLDHFDKLTTQNPDKQSGYAKKKIYLFGFIPLIKINRQPSKTKYYLFSCIPFLKFKG